MSINSRLEADGKNLELTTPADITVKHCRLFCNRELESFYQFTKLHYTNKEHVTCYMSEV